MQVPVTDLRQQPTFSIKEYGKDPHQETQLLLGETVQIEKIEGGWAYVSSLEQKTWVEGEGWKPYPGWIPIEHLIEKKTEPKETITISELWVDIHAQPNHTSPRQLSVSMGTTLEKRGVEGGWTLVTLPNETMGAVLTKEIISGDLGSEEQKREVLMSLGDKLIGAPYHWGGRSAYLEGSVPLTSVDCSGLVNLLYRVIGYKIPRNAQDQLLFCNPCSVEELKPGDLLFSTDPSNERRIDHVMIYAGGEEILEATARTKSVRRVSLKERFDSKLADIFNGCEVADRRLYFGKILY